MNHNETISKLDEIEFHDLIVESLRIMAEPIPKLILGISPFNELTKKHDLFELIFDGIIMLEIDKFYLEKESDLEIYNFEYSYDNSFKCELLLLTGFGGPSVKIKIICSSIELIEVD